jgi:hypothetical protein
MIYIQSLRAQAAWYRELAARQAAADKVDEAKESKDLAEVCEAVAEELEEHMTAG